MKSYIHNLNKAFENRIRLGIMSVLMVNDSVDFSTMKETLELTDGNLASHLKGLEKEEFIDVKKSFIGRKPNTTYFMTKAGKIAFDAHLKALEKLIKSQK